MASQIVNLAAIAEPGWRGVLLRSITHAPESRNLLSHGERETVGRLVAWITILECEAASSLRTTGQFLSLAEDATRRATKEIG
jgi:hypothetical protein